MTNFDKLIKERRELVIDILSSGMCFDEDGEIIAYKDDTGHACLICKFKNAENCEEEIKKWLCEEIEGKDCEVCEYFDVDPLEEPCSSCKDRSNWQEGEDGEE